MRSGFDVWLIAFESNVPDPARALSQAFGLDLRAARELEQTLPRAVKLAVDRTAADRYADALRAIGGKVEVRASRHAPLSSERATPGAQPVVTHPSHTEGQPAWSTRPGPPGLVKARSRSDAPYAFLTFSLPGWTRAVLGAAVLWLGLSFRGNAFLGRGDLLDLLIAWFGATLCTAGLAEAGYGLLRHRAVRLRLPAALLCIAALVWLQRVYGSGLAPN